MSVAVVTGSGGLVGSAAVRHFAGLGMDVVGVDNDMRRGYFGPEGSVADTIAALRQIPGYRHEVLDVRDRDGINQLLARYGASVRVVVHAAAQPSHDLGDHDPLTDWDVNAGGTVNVLDAVRRHASRAVLVHLSTIKVYGPHPNRLPLIELETRYDLEADPYTLYPIGCGWYGIGEDMPIDGGPRSLFGASKTAADVMVQEYGHAYGLHTTVLRPGCLTGPAHAGTEAHGFLAYLMRCVATGRPYRIIGHGGKQVRDQLHAHDVTAAIDAILQDPPEPGSVFNLGGGRGTDVSVLEALDLAEEITGRAAVVEMAPERRGDHRWWITDTARFQARYPAWKPSHSVDRILREIHEAL
jgi:CDP-paratose 2-epimerase